MIRWVLLGFGLGAAWAGWRWVRDHAPLTELDELYPPPRDTYLDELLGNLSGWAGA